MGLSPRYVVLTNAGTWHYHRRVPKAARTTFPQSEFKRLLGDTRREALRNWPHVHAEFERLTSNHAAQQLPTPSATDQLRSMDVYTDSHTEATVSTSPPEQAKSSHHKAKALKPTLADAKQLYLQECIIGDINEPHKTARIERVMTHLHAVIAPNCLLSDLTRSYAREVGDRMLNKLEMTPITVKRYLCDVSAMVNLGLREFDIRDAIIPFLNLPIKIDTVAREGRDPLPEEVLQFMRERLAVHAAPRYIQHMADC